MSARRSPAAERPPAAARGTVLFVHGLWMTGAESFLLRRRLAEHGWVLRAFPYSVMREPLDGVARRCARYARMLALRTRAPVHLVGHSLGGLVIYRMFELGLLQAGKAGGDFRRVVAMGSPLCGSRSGRAISLAGPASALLGLAGREALTCTEPRQWRFPAQLGVIAGDRPHGLGRWIADIPMPNDGTVAVEETQIEGATDRCVLDVSHTGMLWSAEVAEQVASFLERGRFSTQLGRQIGG